MKLLSKGRLIALYEKKVRFPNNFCAKIDVIKHPGAALIVPFLSKDKLIILRQYRPVIGAYLYELPAGTLKKNEPALLCARREIIEETGYSAKKFIKIGHIYPVPGYSTEKIIIYKAEGLTHVGSSAEQDEVLEHRILTRKEVLRLFKCGKITDAKTICALSLCGWL